MKPADRIHVLDQAHASLRWLITEPHTLERAVEVLHDTNQPPAGDGERRPRPIGSGERLGHADPTAGIVGAIAGRMSRAAGDTAKLDAGLATVVTEAAELDALASSALGRVLPVDRPSSRTVMLEAAALHVERLMVAPSINDAWARLDPDEVPVLDVRVGRFGADVAWLGTEVARHLRAAVVDRPEPVQQRRLDSCRIHIRWAREGAAVPLAVPGKSLCSSCENFQQRHHCPPTEAILRRWDYGSAATPAQILEAKAAGLGGRRRKAG